MSIPSRIYLDNAATSWPKPEAVYAAVDEYQYHLGASANRGLYAEAIQVDQAVRAVRQSLATLLAAENPERIIFLANGTDALNLAIHGILKAGDHVVTSVVEHNSALRPLQCLEDLGHIQVTRVPCDSSGLVDPEEFRAAWRPETQLAVLSHASNVTGALQPVAEISRIVHELGGLLLVDAAQSVGHLPIDLGTLAVDLLAASGHKGLLGPQGTGLLYVRPGIEGRLRTLRQGGTGSESELDRQPEFMPDKYESGTLNAPGILGLGAGVHYLAGRGQDEIRRHAVELTRQLLDGLEGLRGLHLLGPRDAAKQVGVVSLTVDEISPQDLATTLDQVYRIQVRSGLHCAPLMHRALGTLSGGGAVRLSLGPFNTSDEIAATVAAMERITTTRKCVPCRRKENVCGLPAAVSAATRAPEVLTAPVLTAPGAAATSDAIPGMRALWAETQGDPAVCVAILDGPVDLSHPALAGADISEVQSLIPHVVDGGPASQHGTQVASIIFGRHGGPVPGIAPGCRGLVIPIFTDGADGAIVPCSQVDLARAINQAVEHGARIINISGGQFSFSGTAHPILADAVRDCAASGVLIIAAAGNQGCDCLHIPAALPTVLAVGAMDNRGNPLEFSNWGYQNEGLLAPGQDLLGAVPGGKTAVVSGTSYATAVASGVAALLLSLERKLGDVPDGRRVRELLLQNRRRLPDGVRLRVPAALGRSAES